MIFVANVLVMNGGTTFLIRLIRERARRGQRSAILLLSNRVDQALLHALQRDAEILYLSDFLIDHAIAARGLLGIFAPLAHRRLAAALAPYGPHLHAMGLFGLIFGLRLAGNDPNRRLTVGIYHQNEFLYRAPPFYFAREGMALFASMPPENIIFFNETSRDNYARHFTDVSYAASSLLPIGITLNDGIAPSPATPGRRIVSIGNLAGFKTYNRHMIGVVAALRHRFPDIRYDIYGVGPMEKGLAALIVQLGVQDHVTLCGPLEYSRLRDVIAGCDLFVGSGTALIEAAAIGRPALIGIESIEEPETYGYLSDITGYSYNENVPSIAKRSMAELISRLFSDFAHWAEIATACTAKAQHFSVEVTADGFEAAGAKARPINRGPSNLKLARLAASAITMRVAERTGYSEPFGDRRNQSYQPS